MRFSNSLDDRERSGFLTGQRIPAGQISVPAGKSDREALEVIARARGNLPREVRDMIADCEHSPTKRGAPMRQIV